MLLIAKNAFLACFWVILGKSYFLNGKLLGFEILNSVNYWVWCLENPNHASERFDVFRNHPIEHFTFLGLYECEHLEWICNLPGFHFTSIPNLLIEHFASFRNH